MKKVILFALLFAPAVAFALETPSALVGASLDLAIQRVMHDLEDIALKILFSLAMLQFVITGVGMLQNGEIDASVGKTAKFLGWIGFCVWLLSPSGTGLSNGSQFIRLTVDHFLALAGSWTALQGMTFDTGDIFLTGLEAYGKITLSVLKATSTNAANALATLFVPGVAFLTALMTFAISAIVLITCAYVALKVFMVKLETMLVVAIAPLSFAFLGLNALRDQGFAPFKSMLALVYRIVVLGAVVASMAKVAAYLANYVDGQSYGLAADVWSPLLAGAFAFTILAFLAHKSDSIASSLANGSVSMGAGDVTAAVAAGAAAGAAVATGGASAVAGAANAGKSMSDVLGAIKGSASVSQAGAGSGGTGAVPGGGADPFKSIGPAPVAPKDPIAGITDKNAREHPSSIQSQARAAEALKSPSAPAPAAKSSSGVPGAAQSSLQNASTPSSSTGAMDSAATPENTANPAAGTAAPAAETAADSAPTKPANEDSRPPSGSGASAGIEGGGKGALADSDKKLDAILDSLMQPKKPSFNDRMATVNDHLVKEQSATHVSVNVNAAD